MIKLDEGWKQKNGKYKCPECGKEYTKNGICTHIWRMHGTGQSHKAGGGWAKGLTKETDKRLMASSKAIAELHKQGFYKDKQVHRPAGWKHTEETIKKMKANPEIGGLRKGAGRGKKGRYKGYWCDSSWELAYVVYNIDHDIKFKRNKKGFDYSFEGEDHKYYPDFILEDGTYVEVKGYTNKKVKAKCKQFNKNLIVLDNIKMQKYINYVENKYGRNFIKLYE